MTPRLLVLGCGSIGRRHITNLRALGVDAVTVFDADPARAAAVSEEHGVPAVASLESGLAARPDGVLVCTPPTDHAPSALRALDAGAAVFIEKPLAAAIDSEVRHLVAHPCSDRALVGYNLRFHKGLQLAARMLAGGAVGRVLMMRVEFGQYLPEWRPTQDYRTGYITRRHEGGILLDASHEIDYARWLAGEVEAVRATLARLSDLEMEAEDTALLTLRHAGGALSEVHLDCVQRGYRRGCRVVGTEGTLEWSFREGVRLTKDGREWTTHLVAPDANDMYLDELRHFLEIVERAARPGVPVRSALATLQVVEAARRSSAERREVGL